LDIDTKVISGKSPNISKLKNILLNYLYNKNILNRKRKRYKAVLRETLAEVSA
jgi:hypothetical protein